MPCRVSYDMKGIEDIIENLSTLGVDVDKSAAKAVAAGGDEILDGMLINVPVGDPAQDPHPGQLKRTLERTEPKMDGNFTFVEVGISRRASADVARYGNAQEYGYRHHPPQSYIRRGFDEKKAAARKALRDSLVKDGMI